MKHIDPEILDRAFAHPSAPMFADVIRRLEQDADLRPSRRRDLISALRRLAQALGRDAENTPAEVRWLQPRLEKLQPARIGVSPKTLSNMISNAQAALGAFGIVEPRINRLADLSPDWLRLWRLALATKNWTLRTSLGRFVYFLNGLRVRPEDVGDDHVFAFRDALAMNRIRKSPDLTCRYAINAWNQAIRLVPEWPRNELTTTDRRKRIKLPAEDLPASFHADLDAMARTFSRPDPLDENGRLTALRPVTIQQYRNQLLRFAAHVVRSGVPTSELTGISCLCDPNTVKRGLRQMLDGNEGKTNRGISETAALLRNLARSYCRLPAQDVAAIARLASRVAMKPQTGMTRKNRERLRVLQDPTNQRRLINLPERLFSGARPGRKAHARALDREMAIAIAILQFCPVRVKNVAGIHLERHLQRPGDGRVFLALEEGEIKNKRFVEFELPPHVARMIDRHVAERAPRLCPKGCMWLFPRRDGSGPIRECDISQRIKDCIGRETGMEVNPHLFRHLAAMIWLDANPGSYEAVRRLLGHSELSHTLNLYTGMEHAAAIRAYSDLLMSDKETR